MLTLLRMPLPLVLAAVPKSTQKDTWCIQIFFRSNTTERATYLLQNFTWYSGSYTRRTAGCLSLAILSSQLAVEVYRHQTGSSYFVLTLFFK